MKEIDKFLKTIEEIRDPKKGCVWNLKQSHGSLKRYMLEESYEALEALDLVEESNGAAGFDNLKEELGDLLLQIVLHSRIAEENGRFSFADVVNSIDTKMIKRHPHVFASDAAGTTEEVDKLWDAEKAKEKKARQGLFEGIPVNMPALARAWKISKKAVTESFEWDEENKLWGQLDSEVRELQEVIENYRLDTGKDPYQDGYDNERTRIDAELELGDILFTVVNIARWYKIDPEDALRRVNNKFIDRFTVMQDLCKKRGLIMKECDVDTLEGLWSEAKIMLGSTVW
ncbi:MAG: nucleoside triphosphate pyrophosphohydrolase [Cyanobacteria bacterium]|nr:nucleoside triphosphate pyrophosphohydrolase [Cyanobacteriota bacterium]MDA1019964.1 nucleoside triphosphate pyrophosphohydrolase [Cyanobacteriota bacterium]